ncbi:unnamed protein product, partial [Prunus brigantina]
LSKLEVQIGQIAAEIAQREPGKWPSQTVINPKIHEAKAIHVLRSGKIVDNKVGSDLSNDVVVVENEDEEETTAVEGERPKTSQSAPKAKSDSQEPNPFQLHKRDDKFVPPHLCEDRYIPPPPYIPPIPFPGRLKKANQDKAFKEIYDILSKVNINLPLLDVVKQIPAYGKFIKHLITHKLNFAPSEEVKLNKNVSALGLEGMKKTSIRLELADHSIKYPKGIVEDILVQVNTLILPADFVVMDMEDNPHEGRVDPILLGRPFMATANTIINVKDGTLSMTVLGETIAFKVFDALKPNVVQECFQIEVFGNSGKDKFNGLPHSIEACLLQGVDKEEHVAAHMFNAILPTHKEELPRFGDSLITPPILCDSIHKKRKKRKAARKRRKRKTSLVNNLALHGMPIELKPPHSI